MLKSNGVDVDAVAPMLVLWGEAAAARSRSSIEGGVVVVVPKLREQWRIHLPHPEQLGSEQVREAISALKGFIRQREEYNRRNDRSRRRLAPAAR